MGTFHDSGGGERPAGSTLALVLNWSNSASGDPVYGQGLGRGELGVDTVLLRLFEVGLEPSELLFGPVGELVMADDVGLSRIGVVSLDKFVLLQVLCESKLILRFSAIRFSPTSNSLYKFTTFGGGGNSANNSSSDKGLHICSI